MPIQLLDTHTAELIAAGEVVERPSSAIKELVENAIDAGASSIKVEIERGGLSLMRVTDDGGGIVGAEIPLAFLRHATSKVRTHEDLNDIRTLGFRGEALASVASVARVELLTKHQQDEYASLFTIEGGQQGAVQEAARPGGTTITIRDLFYNTPARMKFLKKDSSEAAFVTEAMSRLALSHPNIAFHYIKDGRPVFSTPGSGDLQAAIYSVLGAEFGRDLVPVGYMDKHSRVLGFVTQPRGGRGSRGMQFYYINGRFVKNRTMMAGLEQAYRGTMMQGKFPGGVLFLHMPPELVDVNVHPAKTEVRFAHEQEIFGIVYRAVKEALQLANTHSQFSFGGEEAPEPAPPSQEAPQTSFVAATPSGGTSAAGISSAATATSDEAPPPPSLSANRAGAYPFGATPQQPAPAYEPAKAYSPASGEVKGYNQMVEQAAAHAGLLESDGSAIRYQTSPLSHPSVPAAFAPLASERGLDITADDEETSPVPQQLSVVEEIPEAEGAKGRLRLVGELFKTYIVAEADDLLCLIDKHAAHERLLYQQLADSRGSTAAQQLLSPVHVALAARDKNALLQNDEALLDAGIEVEDFGDNTVLVRAVPADVEMYDIAGLIEEVGSRLALNEKDALNEKTEWVLHSIACRAAVKAGDKNQPEQLLALAQDILSGTVPPFCPHGRPVVLEITRKELEKQFGRLG